MSSSLASSPSATTLTIAQNSPSPHRHQRSPSSPHHSLPLPPRAPGRIDHRCAGRVAKTGGIIHVMTAVRDYVTQLSIATMPIYPRGIHSEPQPSSQLPLAWAFGDHVSISVSGLGDFDTNSAWLLASYACDCGRRRTVGRSNLNIVGRMM